jgi:hypothetical protein
MKHTDACCITTALALAKKIFGPKYRSMTLELNASDDRGIDVVKEKIKDFAGTRTIFGSGFKMILLDEADNMTNSAQMALRRIVEVELRACASAFYVFDYALCLLIPAPSSWILREPARTGNPKARNPSVHPGSILEACLLWLGLCALGFPFGFCAFGCLLACNKHATPATHAHSAPSSIFF